MGRHMGLVLAVACLGLAACASAKDEPAKPAAAKPAAPQAEDAVAQIEDALTKAGAKRADTAALMRLISGRTIYGTGSTGRPFLIYFTPKGTMKMSAAEGKFTDSGTWKVEDSILCYTWTNPKTGNDCEKVFVLPDGKVVYTTATGKRGSFDAFGEGNLEKL